ncbi:MAG: CHRD domain-containing protein [Blastocatellia bacterium]
MRRSIASIVLMVLTVVSVASMMMRSAKADIVVFTTQLIGGANEVPPVTNADINAFGNVTIVLDTATNLFRFDWSVSNLAASSIILSHIHEGVAGVAGPVRVDSLISPASPVAVVNGNAVFSRSGLPGPADVVTRLLANPAGFYFNVHSNLNPGGVVRGQLVRQAAAGAGGAPTLSEWGAILMGLLIVAACVFFLAGRAKTATVLAAGASSAPFDGQVNGINWRLLLKVAIYVEAAIGIALFGLSAGPVDVGGALTSGLIISFIIHLVIAGARRR